MRVKTPEAVIERTRHGQGASDQRGRLVELPAALAHGAHRTQGDPTAVERLEAQPVAAPHLPRVVLPGGHVERRNRGRDDRLAVEQLHVLDEAPNGPVFGVAVAVEKHEDFPPGVARARVLRRRGAPAPLMARDADLRKAGHRLLDRIVRRGVVRHDDLVVELRARLDRRRDRSGQGVPLVVGRDDDADSHRRCAPDCGYNGVIVAAGRTMGAIIPRSHQFDKGLGERLESRTLHARSAPACRLPIVLKVSPPMGDTAWAKGVLSGPRRGPPASTDAECSSPWGDSIPGVATPAGGHVEDRSCWAPRPAPPRSPLPGTIRLSRPDREYVAEDRYDELLSRNVVITEAFDASANNVVIECLARNTPLIVNRHPAIVEYLSADYPLFFDDIDEVPGLLRRARVLAAHRFLKALDKTRLSGDCFRESIRRALLSVLPRECSPHDYQS